MHMEWKCSAFPSAPSNKRGSGLENLVVWFEVWVCSLILNLNYFSWPHRERRNVTLGGPNFLTAGFQKPVECLESERPLGYPRSIFWVQGIQLPQEPLPWPAVGSRCKNVASGHSESTCHLPYGCRPQPHPSVSRQAGRGGAQASCFRSSPGVRLPQRTFSESVALHAA